MITKCHELEDGVLQSYTGVSWGLGFRVIGFRAFEEHNLS